MTLFEQFKRNRDEHPDTAAFLIAAGDRSVPITWREFARDIEAVAWMIRTFTPGATIGLLGENSYEWITAHAAGLFCGITVVPLEVTLSPAEIAERLAFVGARVLVHSALYVDKALEVAKLLPGPALIVAGFGSHKADDFMQRARAALDAGEAGIFDLPPPDENATATIVFTSGTTSKPHGAELTLQGLATFVAFASTKLPMKRGDRSLMLLPLHHIYGIATTYLMLARGVALGVCPDFRRIYDAVERFRANFLCLVPALAEILAGKIDRRGRSAEEVFGVPVDWVLSGGAPLSRRTHEHLESLGMRVLQIYGLTETFALYAISPYDDPRPGSVGQACGGFGGMETKATPEGALLIRGPSVLKGYFREPERTAQTKDAEGWFNTGDIGRIDEDGYVWVTGRASRTIVLSSGKKVAPEELEAKVLSIPGVNEVVVSGDGATRELKAEIYAVVSEVTLRRQIELLNRQLPVYKRIREIEVRKDPFPRTASGKIKVATEPSATLRAPSAYVPVGEPPAAVVAATAKGTVPVAGPQPGADMPAKPVKPHDVAAFFKAYVLPLTVVAIVVMLVNVLKLVLRHNGLALPESLRTIEEIGELVLAVLVILVVMGVQHRNRKKNALLQNKSKK